MSEICPVCSFTSRLLILLLRYLFACSTDDCLGRLISSALNSLTVDPDETSLAFCDAGRVPRNAGYEVKVGVLLD